jgi:hypothetical protein
MRARNPQPSKLSSRRSWHAVYRAALFENDPLKIPDRILQAERVLILRARKLFNTSKDKFEERQAVHHALYTLSALRDSLKSSKSSA